MKVTRLVCSNCGSPLNGMGTDRLFLCRNCGSGWSSSDKGLEPLNVEHRCSEEAEIPLPFWKVDAAIHVLKRTVRNEFTATILRFGSRYDEKVLPGKTQETGGSSQRRILLFPAFQINGLPSIGVSLSSCLDSLPEIIDDSDNMPFVCGGAVSPEDALVLAKCVAVGQETEKSDKLAEIELVLSAARETLVILPCSAEVEKVRIADTGVSFFRRSVPEWNRLLEYRSSQA